MYGFVVCTLYVGHMERRCEIAVSDRRFLCELCVANPSIWPMQRGSQTCAQYSCCLDIRYSTYMSHVYIGYTRCVFTVQCAGL